MHCCYGITALPESFSDLSALEDLNLYGCLNISHLDDSLGDLIALQKLVLPKTTKLPECARQRLKENGCRLAYNPEHYGPQTDDDDDTLEP